MTLQSFFCCCSCFGCRVFWVFASAFAGTIWPEPIFLWSVFHSSSKETKVEGIALCLISTWWFSETSLSIINSRWLRSILDIWFEKLSSMKKKDGSMCICIRRGGVRNNISCIFYMCVNFFPGNSSSWHYYRCDHHQTHLCCWAFQPRTTLPQMCWQKAHVRKANELTRFRGNPRPRLVVPSA